MMITGSWKWISDPINQLDDKLKKVHNIHQFEKALSLMTISFLGIWIFLTEVIDSLIAIEKESVSLLILFYIASFLGLGIIALRFIENFHFPLYYALTKERIIFGILAAISLIIFNINTILCQKNFNKKFYLLNYEIEMPKEFDYDYDPKQDDESESSKSESEEESLIIKCKKYVKKKYHQYKNDISNFLE
ncbi:836_t:CDS:2 [Rhizophagus irregularis]|nr:836_t:CDS:2 [Rhizophagus irregularis]